MEQNTTDITDITDTLIGADGHDYCLTAKELRAIADLIETAESLDPQTDMPFELDVDGLLFRLILGYDSTGNFGVLEASI